VTGSLVHHTWAGACRVGPQGQEPWEGHRVLLLGEDNPQSDDPTRALWAAPTGVAGERLQSKILQLGHATYYGLWRTNLCSPTWNRAAAEERAAIVLSTGWTPWTTVVCLGRKVSTVVGGALGQHLDTWSWYPWWKEVDDWASCELADFHVSIVSLPHPSGRTRDWNDPANFGRALDLLREVAPQVPFGELGRIPGDAPQVGT